MDISTWTRRHTRGAEVTLNSEGGCTLRVPPGDDFRLAQLDDYKYLPRGSFHHAAPLALELRARVSAQEIPGTWGFGFWNDPFGFGFGKGGGLRLPALPNAAWFFHASPQNYLSLSDRHPGAGYLAGAFHAALIPPILLLPGAPALALLLWPRAARLIRRLAARVVREDAAALDLDVTQWHTYRLELGRERTHFRVDGAAVFECPFAPRGKMGAVIWMDNQFARFSPDGRVRAGILPFKEAAWVEVEGISIQAGQSSAGGMV